MVDSLPRLHKWKASRSVEYEARLRTAIAGILTTSRCTLRTAVPSLWTDDNSLTHVIGDFLLHGHGGKRMGARSGRDFEWLLLQGHFSGKGAAPDIPLLLKKLLESVLPEGQTAKFF